MARVLGGYYYCRYYYFDIILQFQINGVKFFHNVAIFMPLILTSGDCNAGSPIKK